MYDSVELAVAGQAWLATHACAHMHPGSITRPDLCRLPFFICVFSLFLCSLEVPLMLFLRPQRSRIQRRSLHLQDSFHQFDTELEAFSQSRLSNLSIATKKEKMISSNPFFPPKFLRVEKYSFRKLLNSSRGIMPSRFVRVIFFRLFIFKVLFS